MRLCIDMDGVVCDFLTPLIRQYNHVTNEGVKLEDIKSPNTAKWVGDRWTLMRIKDTPGFIYGLKPIDGAIDAIRDLHKAGHDIVFVSNGTNCPTSGHEKREWLRYYFGRLWKKPQLVLTYHKHLVPGHVLLEDNPKNLKKLEHGTKPLLFHRHYNAQEQGFDRVYDWSDFLRWVDAQ